MTRYKLLGDQKDIDYGTVHEQHYELKINMAIVDQYGYNYENCFIHYTLHYNNIKLSELIQDIDNYIKMRYLLNIYHLFDSWEFISKIYNKKDDDMLVSRWLSMHAKKSTDIHIDGELNIKVIINTVISN